jgi:hypothetical protein
MFFPDVIIYIFQTLKTATSSALTSKFATCHVIVTECRIFSRCGGDIQWDNIHTMNIQNIPIGVSITNTVEAAYYDHVGTRAF